MAVLFVVLVVAEASLVPAITSPSGGDPFFLTLLAGRIGESLAPRTPVGLFVVSLLVLALAGGLFQALVLAWTGNRVVSLAAAVLLVLHPAVAPAAPDALYVILPALPVFACLLARERAFRARAGGRPALIYEVVAVFSYLLSGFAGPVALATPLLVALVEVVFQDGARREGVLRRVLPRFLLYALLAPLLVLIVRKGPSFAAPDASLAPGFRSLLLVPPTSVLAPLVDLTGLVLAVAGLAALAIGVRQLVSRPRWLLVHLGWATTWFLACHAASFVPTVPRGDWGRCLALAGPALLLPSAAWRAVMALWQRARASWQAPGEAPAMARPPVQPPPDAATVQALVDASLKRGLPAALDALLRERRAAAGPGPAVGSAWADAWERRESAWRARFGKTAPRAKLGEEWTEEELAENVFRSYLLPHLAPSSRVLEIGAAGGAYTSLLAPEVFQVVCLDPDAARIGRLRAGAPRLQNVSLVRSDGPGLGAIGAGTIDLVFSADAFTRMEQEQIYRHLRELTRVLRPGGRAVLAFANLLDPTGFQAFEARAAQAAEEPEDRRVFITPEIMRTLVAAAGLRLEALHLGADGTDMLAVMERVP